MVSSRRSLLVGIGALTTCFAAKVFAQGSSSAEPYADDAAADRWMKQWMSVPAAASGTLHLGRFADAVYFLLKKIVWTPNPGQQVPEVQIPEGFVTDFASIPRAFWTLLPPDGDYTYPAIIHDYLYWDQSTSRETADLIFRYAMEEFKVSARTINTIYAGVQAGGGVAWRSNAKLKASGEKRILRTYPKDPTIRWKEWKQRARVF